MSPVGEEMGEMEGQEEKVVGEVMEEQGEMEHVVCLAVTHTVGQVAMEDQEAVEGMEEMEAVVDRVVKGEMVAILGLEGHA